MTASATHGDHNKAIVDIRLRPRCALPSPASWPIGRVACAQNVPDSYLRLTVVPY